MVSWLKRVGFLFGLGLLLVAASPRVVRAADADAASAISAADTAWLLVSAALVMLMTPGLGLFYGGMVRRKNVLATFQQSFILLGFVALQWALFGYSLAFSPDLIPGFVGGFDWFGLAGVGLDPATSDTVVAKTIPHQLFMVYQMMFAVITPALISGAFAERMKFSAYLAFTLLWATLVYDPVAHWVWGGGWVGAMGALDFAGGLVVHVISGVAALCCVLVMGKRKGLGQEEMHPHNLTLTAIGTGILWFGWFGFNGGSALGSTQAAVAAFVNTQMAAAAATASWAMIEWLHKGKATVLGACTGAVAGLVAVTPCAGYVTPIGALVIGLLVPVFCYGAILLKSRLGYDDSLDVFGVHGVGGAFGAICVGIFASKAVTAISGVNVDPSTGTALGVSGLLEGDASLLFKQLTSLAAAVAYSFVVTFVILKGIDLTLGLRATTEEEEVGLDLTQHGERGYIMGAGELVGGGLAEPSLPPLSALAGQRIEEHARA